MAKKKPYKSTDMDEKELQRLKKHSDMIEGKVKAVIEKYRKWWDKDKRTWKKGFKEHGNS